MALGLNSQHNQFIFSFPQDFVPDDISKKYKTHLDRFHSPFEDIVDYLNNTIQTISFPGLTFEVSEQLRKYGKKINYRSAQSPYDVFNRKFAVTMNSVDNHANYFMMQDILLYHYINTQEIFVNPFLIIVLDKNREENFRYELREIVFTGLSDLKFDYQDTDAESKVSFNVDFMCNFIDPSYTPNNNLRKLVRTRI
jgi:hypothetical protein